MKNRTTAVWLLILIWSVTGCAVFKGSYGAIVPDDSTRKNFESYRMDPSMSYYYSGADAHPNAVIGLKKSYELDNDLWKSIEPNDVKFFKGLIRGMQEKGGEFGLIQYGYVMQDPQGKPLGVWYSALALKTMMLKMGTGNKVIVYTPELEVYPIRTLGASAGGHGGD